MTLTISEVKTQLKSLNYLDDPLVAELRTDTRKGVQSALVAFEKRIQKQIIAKEAFEKRFKYEKSFWSTGNQYVAGMDEVGRGPLAGPVVTAAVILDESFDLIGVTDSKLLTANEREHLYLKIIEEAIEVNICVKDRDFIDQHNIYHATQLAMIETIQGLQHQPTQIIVDAVPLDLNIPQTTLIKGDQKSISVAAASIVAKEYRDHLMDTYDKVYPGYDFAHNKGYGTAKHLAGLKQLGITPIHRMSFSPVPEYK